jgi:hypothetical protein
MYDRYNRLHEVALRSGGVSERRHRDPLTERVKSLDWWRLANDRTYELPRDLPFDMVFEFFKKARILQMIDNAELGV